MDKVIEIIIKLKNDIKVLDKEREIVKGLSGKDIKEIDKKAYKLILEHKKEYIQGLIIEIKERFNIKGNL